MQVQVKIYANSQTQIIHTITWQITYKRKREMVTAHSFWIQYATHINTMYINKKRALSGALFCRIKLG